MNFLNVLWEEIIGFFGIGLWLDLFRSGDYSKLQTLEGVTGAIGPLIPLILIIEIIRAVLYKKFSFGEYRIQFIIYIFNRFLSRFISIAAVSFCIGVFEKYRLFTTTFTWYWLVYGYIVWELAHFVYHFLGHKVRLFWCLHSTHHAPQTMNLSVTFAHFFLEAPYADLIRTTICLLLGVNPPLLFFIMFIDGTWGAFIHVGEHIMKDGRMGFLEKYILTPSHHRVHHARNPIYMDTNFCNLLNIWDRFLGTYQREEITIAPEYGITREMNPNSFMDVYFGEFVALARDIARAPSWKDKILYIFMPPGWSHTGLHRTAKQVRASYFDSRKN